jgi:cell division septal protein FtsQ
MMMDLRHIGSQPNRKVSANRMKVRREPIDLRKYLQPLVRIVGRGTLVLVAIGMFVAAVRNMRKATPFPVQHVTVRGAERISREEIIALTGITPGQNLLSVRLKSVGQQVAKNPWVASVRVQRFFPGTVAVSVTEREPLAVVNLGLLYYLDAKGEVFKPLNHGDRLDFPIVTGFTEDELSTDPAGTRESLKAACDLVLALKQHGSFILADVSEIHYDRGYGFTLFTTTGALPIKVGNGDFAGKLTRFAQIYQTLLAQRATLQYIDLDYNDRIVVKKS